MTNPNRVSRTGSWIALGFNLDILNQIRTAAAKASADGGDAGGLLLGSLSEDRLSIWGSEPIECEHAFGPAFVLSLKDQAGLARQIQQLGREERTGQRQIVGWYRSHLQGGVRLTREDLALHAEYFPQPWQVAMALSPDARGGMQAGLYFQAGRPAAGRVGGGMAGIFGDEPFLFDLETLAAVRAEVAKAAQQAPNPGPSLGGVLTGARKREGWSINGFEPLPRDEAIRGGLRSRLGNSALEAYLRDRGTAAGWYHFQERDSVALTAEDLRVHERYFQEAGQTALVVRIQGNGGAHAEFFFKEPVAVGNSGVMLEQTEVPDVASPLTLLTTRGRPASEATRSVALTRVYSEPPSARAGSVALAVSKPGPAISKAAPDEWPRKLQREYLGWKRTTGAKHSWPVLTILGLLFAACLVAVIVLRLNNAVPDNAVPAKVQTGDGVLRMRAVQRDGSVELSWDVQAVGQALIGNLEIQDGAKHERMVLDQDVLRQGGLAYTAKSDVTDFRLQVERADGSILEAVTTFVASGPPALPGVNRTKSPVVW